MSWRCRVSTGRAVWADRLHESPHQGRTTDILICLILTIPLFCGVVLHCTIPSKGFISIFQFLLYAYIALLTTPSSVHAHFQSCVHQFYFLFLSVPFNFISFVCTCFYFFFQYLFLLQFYFFLVWFVLSIWSTQWKFLFLKVRHSPFFPSEIRFFESLADVSFFFPVWLCFLSTTKLTIAYMQ